MADKQISVRIKSDGGAQLRSDFKAIGQDAQTAFAQVEKGAGAGRAGLLNVGYQVQDFAVQVAGGTSASRALAQQLPQLLSGFGLFGVLAGTAAAVLVPLIGYLIGGAEKSKTMTDRMKDLSSSTRDYEAAAGAAAVSIEELRKKYGGMADIVDRALQSTRDLRAEEARQAMSGVAKGTGFDVDGTKVLAREAILKRVQAAEQEYSAAVTVGDINRAQAAVQMMPALMAQLAPLASIRESVEALTSKYKITGEQVANLAIATQALNNANGGQAQADAAEQLRQKLVEVFGSAEKANAATGGLVDMLNEAVISAGNIAKIDIAGPIAAGAAAASKLVTYLDAAVTRSGQIEAMGRAYAVANAPGASVRGLDDERGSQSGARRDAAINNTARILETGFYKPKSGGTGGGGVDKGVAEAARIYDSTRTAAEKYRIELAKIDELHRGGYLDADTYGRAVDKLGEQFDKTSDMGKKAAGAIRSAFDGLFDDPAAALKNLGKQLAQMAIYQTLAKGLPNIFGSGGYLPLLASAKGNVFDGGQHLQAFAAGGIVSRATTFPMKNGTGLMGEAGPEAIMPLTRIGGRLGVAASGGGGSAPIIQIVNTTGQPARTEQSKGPDGRSVVRVVVGEEIARGRLDKPMSARFGSRPKGVLR